MKAMILRHLVGVIMGMLTPELLKSFADMVLDFVEDYVEGTKSKIDDRLVLPLCASIRAAFDIPDND
ncbi:hypothetical protein LCGC14_1594320 [marine sediment metagenome]|uniref:Uncharacterized protein n=1 Tax=marine sediment metagenome TaxID=412755 RepID=A0A0F9KTW5_9ZZZZ